MISPQKRNPCRPLIILVFSVVISLALEGAQTEDSLTIVKKAVSHLNDNNMHEAFVCFQLINRNNESDDIHMLAWLGLGELYFCKRAYNQAYKYFAKIGPDDKHALAQQPFSLHFAQSVALLYRIIIHAFKLSCGENNALVQTLLLKLQIESSIHDVRFHAHILEKYINTPTSYLALDCLNKAVPILEHEFWHRVATYNRISLLSTYGPAKLELVDTYMHSYFWRSDAQKMFITHKLRTYTLLGLCTMRINAHQAREHFSQAYSLAQQNQTHGYVPLRYLVRYAYFGTGGNRDKKWAIKHAKGVAAQNTFLALKIDALIFLGTHYFLKNPLDGSGKAVKLLSYGLTLLKRYSHVPFYNQHRRRALAYLVEYFYVFYAEKDSPFAKLVMAALEENEQDFPEGTPARAQQISYRICERILESSHMPSLDDLEDDEFAVIDIEKKDAETENLHEHNPRIEESNWCKSVALLRMGSMHYKGEATQKVDTEIALKCYARIAVIKSNSKACLGAIAQILAEKKYKGYELTSYMEGIIKNRLSISRSAQGPCT